MERIVTNLLLFGILVFVFLQWYATSGMVMRCRRRYRWVRQWVGWKIGNTVSRVQKWQMRRKAKGD